MKTEACARGCAIRHRHLSLCADAETCPGCLPRPAAHGRLCAPCYERASTALQELPDQRAALAERLAPARRQGQSQVSGTPERSLPVDPTVVEHRDSIARVLTSWAVMQAEQLRVSKPRSPQPHVTAHWLLARLDWAAGQEWVADYVTELVDLRKRAHQLLHPSGRRRILLGACPEEGCEGALEASVARTDDLLPSQITCGADPDHTWPTRDWLKLGQRIHGAA